ncbi:MAG TPA: hypothetical protein PKM73_16455 [Verrucomicrobiota bacterium]|nr:hypothetical protein [Verrucomicrobiota bacterium]HNU51111.1 hypothetical protein [Verrucomicrobiota bacterium]
MNDTQEQHRRIDWFKSYRNLALAVWGFLTYVALLGGIAWLVAATAGPNPKAVAVMAVMCATSVNWVMFAAIERQTRN